MIRVTVTSVDYDGHSTIAQATGIREYDGGRETVHFAGDWRPMKVIAEALETGEEVIVYLEDWQITGVE